MLIWTIHLFFIVTLSCLSCSNVSDSHNLTKGAWVAIERNCSADSNCQDFGEKGRLEFEFYDNGTFFYRNTFPEYKDLPMTSRGEYKLASKERISLRHLKRNRKIADEIIIISIDNKIALIKYQNEIFKMKKVWGLKTG